MVLVCLVRSYLIPFLSHHFLNMSRLHSNVFVMRSSCQTSQSCTELWNLHSSFIFSSRLARLALFHHSTIDPWLNNPCRFVAWRCDLARQNTIVACPNITTHSLLIKKTCNLYDPRAHSKACTPKLRPLLRTCSHNNFKILFTSQQSPNVWL